MMPVMTSKVIAMAAEGWELGFCQAAGVESDAGKGDGQGIFITRYTFKRPKLSNLKKRLARMRAFFLYL
jgi:hypothetical protein